MALSVWAEIDLAHIKRNTAAMKALVEPARLMAVVKANGYGHGDVEVAKAAIAGGADWLGVARVEEGESLRRAGIARPILLMSEPVPQSISRVVELGLTPTVYTLQAAEAFARAGRATGRGYVEVHLKLDTGMHRYGMDPSGAEDFVRRLEETKGIQLTGIWSHLASGDQSDGVVTARQLESFSHSMGKLSRPVVIRHLCNSGGAITSPAARLDMVRVGICIYGIHPAEDLRASVDLEPAMSVKSRVVFVKRVKKGEGISYGLRYEASRETTIVTVPCGYADGLPRGWSEKGEALIGGRRYPIAGTITMDHLMVDVGADEVEIGSEVVLLGRQGGQEITATEIANELRTIPYEIVTGISARVPRIYRNTSADG